VHFKAAKIPNVYSETSLNWPALGPIKKGRFRGVTGFVKITLKRNVRNRQIVREGRFSEGPV
jgi:hypothetical protein